MNRSERRRTESNYKKNSDIINKLTPAQVKLMERITEEKSIKKSNKYIQEFGELIDRNMTAALLEHGLDYKEAINIQDVMSEFLLEDSLKNKKLEEEKTDMTKIEIEVKEEIEGMLKAGFTKKQDMETLMYKFPKLSKSMLLNAYSKIKEDMGLVKDTFPKEVVDAYFLKNEIKLSGKEMVTGAMSKFSFTENTAKTYYGKWKKEYMLDKTSNDPLIKKQTIEKATPEELQENAVKIIEAAKEIQCKEEVVTIKRLKVIEEKVVKSIKVEGENGTYAAETSKGVTLSREDRSISFASEEELNEWVKEFKQVFAMVG